MDGVLFDKGVSTLMQYPSGKVGAYVIPNSVTNLETSMANCELGGPNGCAIWRDYGPFVDCTRMTSVTIPIGMTYIPDSTFFRCTGLTSVTIPTSVTNIGQGVFLFCTSLRPQ